jgi:hypothetical protein
VIKPYDFTPIKSSSDSSNKTDTLGLKKSDLYILNYNVLSVEEFAMVAFELQHKIDTRLKSNVSYSDMDDISMQLNRTLSDDDTYGKYNSNKSLQVSTDSYVPPSLGQNMSLSAVLVKGELYKQGHKIRNWKKRMFVLRGCRYNF